MVSRPFSWFTLVVLAADHRRVRHELRTPDYGSHHRHTGPPGGADRGPQAAETHHQVSACRWAGSGPVPLWETFPQVPQLHRLPQHAVQDGERATDGGYFLIWTKFGWYNSNLSKRHTTDLISFNDSTTQLGLLLAETFSSLSAIIIYIYPKSDSSPLCQFVNG